MAAGPVVATSHAGSGDSNHPAEHDQAEGQGGSGPGQAAKQPGVVSLGWAHLVAMGYGLWAMGYGLLRIVAVQH
jgi:hypothetical protein